MTLEDFVAKEYKLVVEVTEVSPETAKKLGRYYLMCGASIFIEDKTDLGSMKYYYCKVRITGKSTAIETSMENLCAELRREPYVKSVKIEPVCDDVYDPGHDKLVTGIDF